MQHNQQPMADAVRAVLKSKKMTIKAGAKALEISYIHLSFLLTGKRNFNGLSLPTQERLIKLMGIKKSEMLVLCGVLKREDIYPTNQTDLIEKTLLQLQSDSYVKSLKISNQDLENIPLRIIQLLAILYQNNIRVQPQV
jgi:transcriptional regulator with XRE-family HTH domain